MPNRPPSDETRWALGAGIEWAKNHFRGRNCPVRDAALILPKTRGGVGGGGGGGSTPRDESRISRGKKDRRDPVCGLAPSIGPFFLRSCDTAMPCGREDPSRTAATVASDIRPLPGCLLVDPRQHPAASAPCARVQSQPDAIRRSAVDRKAPRCFSQTARAFAWSLDGYTVTARRWIDNNHHKATVRQIPTRNPRRLDAVVVG